MRFIPIQLLLLLSFIYAVSSLHCEACFGQCLCLHPIPVKCPPDEVCFAQMSHFGGFIRKGCTTNCTEIGSQCSTCNADFCNSHEDIKPDPDTVEDCHAHQEQEVIRHHQKLSCQHVISVSMILLSAGALFA